jgi:hypothetical protein
VMRRTHDIGIRTIKKIGVGVEREKEKFSKHNYGFPFIAYNPNENQKPHIYLHVI